MKNPKVSVILTSYNHADFIGKSIDSILNQTFTDFELLIVDDCSTDHSWEIISGYKDPRIQAVRHEINWGADGVIFDMVDNHANGEYCAIAHCDDLWKPEKLKKQVEFLDEHSDIAACFTLVDVIDEKGNLLNHDGSLYSEIFEQPNKSRFEWLNHFFYQSNCLCHPSILIRKHAYRECGMDVRGLSALPDYCQWIRLCMKKEIWILQEKLTLFRLRENGQNTSGETYSNTNLLHSEHYIVLKEYLKINIADDFIRVFPQAKKYLSNNEIVVEFAYAKILLEENNKNSYHLFGIDLLSSIFENKELREKIKKLYHYTIKEFKKDKSKYDIFSIVGRSHLMNASLYFDFGQGFHEEDKIASKNILINANKYFTVTFHIEDFIKNENKNIKSIRFDPDENIFRKYKIESVLIDERQVNIKPLNTDLTKDSWNIFYTDDPTYIIEHSGPCKKISISGIAEENLHDLHYLINNLVQKNNEQSQLNQTLMQQNQIMAQQNQIMTQQNQIMMRQNSETERILHQQTHSFSWRITKPLRVLARVFKSNKSSS